LGAADIQKAVWHRDELPSDEPGTCLDDEHQASAAAAAGGAGAAVAERVGDAASGGAGRTTPGWPPAASAVADLGYPVGLDRRCSQANLRLPRPHPDSTGILTM